MGVKTTELEITIDSKGDVSIKVKGVKGKGCIDASKFLEEALGDVKEREYTSEYYEPEEARTKTRVSY
jgi:hypothetical protein